jgi:hypothetical protein
MKKLLSLLAIAISTNGIAQINLVPNSGFETYVTCPDWPGQLNYAAPWAVVNGTSSDYYNSCSMDWGVPISMLAPYQNAKAGVAFAGIVVYGAADYREYLQVQLTTPLVPDSCYAISYYCNLSHPNDNSTAINSMGMFLSDTAITEVQAGGGSVLQAIPQIISSTFLTDTADWTLVSGVYTAQGGENYITIGNFLNNALTDTMHVHGSTNNSYYLIDEVSVKQVSGCVNVGINELGKNTAFVYPNPGTGLYRLEGVPANSKLELRDIHGRLIRSITVTTNELDVRDLAEGIYFYTVLNRKQVLARGKVLKH